MKMVFGELPAVPSGLLSGEDATQGSAIGSTLGYIPAAASRLKILAISRDLNLIHDTLDGDFRERLPPFFSFFRGADFTP